MLHVKTNMSANNDNSEHDGHFIKEYLNYTPSALYGHCMIPPLTLPK